MKTIKFLRIIFAIQLTIIGLVGSASFGFDIPVLRQIIGFVYLTFVPGLLFLRIIKLPKLEYIETLLYSVGLSIAFVMFTGFFMNMLYPLIGFSRPISLLPVIVTITFIVLISCVVIYKCEAPEEKHVFHPHNLHRSELFSPPALLMLLLPLLAALGTSLVNSNLTNNLSLIFLSLVVIVVLLITFDKFIPKKIYPLTVVAIGLGLLWQWSLISPDLVGFDIHHEYFVQNLVLRNSVWNPDFPWNTNAMLSVVMLPPIYSLVLNLNTVWVFKIFYPLLFSLVPLALFQTYRKQTDDKVAFFGTLVFMSYLTFFRVMIDLPRQQIGELFLALSLLLFIDKEMAGTKRAILLVIFGISIVVSHYAVSYIYILYLLMASALLFLWRSDAVLDLWGRIGKRFSKSKHSMNFFGVPSVPTSRLLQRNSLSTTYVMLFVVFCLSWYIYVSVGSPLDNIARIGNHIYTSITTDFLSPAGKEEVIMQVIGKGQAVLGIEQMISRIIYQTINLFIMVGVIELFMNLRKTKFHPIHVVMAVISLLIFVLCIILPYFASAINMTRIYHIALIFLSPFCVLGGKAFFRWSLRLFSMLLHRNLSTSASLPLVVILVLVPYFLFNTGFVPELTGNPNKVMTLALYDNDNNFFTQPEIYAREWLANKREHFPIFSDLYGYIPLYQKFASSSERFSRDFKSTPQRSYIFLRRWNIVHGEVFVSIGGPSTHIGTGSEQFKDSLRSRNKLYSSGVAQIYY